MRTLTQENTMVLPEDGRVRRAPSCFANDLWFELKTWDPAVDAFDEDIMDALIAEGIGERRRCPADGENAAFCIVGGIIAAITRKYLVFPKKASPLTSPWVNEHFVWEVLWNTAEQHREKINTTFLASVLRNFLPRQHDPPMDRPHYESRFVTRWRFLAYPLTYPLTWPSEPQTICPEHIERGKKALSRLPPASAASVKKAAFYIPDMLTIFAEHAHV